MASNPYATTLQADNARAAIAEIKTLTVDRLKKVLRTGGLAVSGIKSELQLRLIRYIEQCAEAGDFARIEVLRSTAKGMTGVLTHHYPSPYSNHTPNSASPSPQFNSPAPRNITQMPPFPMASYPSSRLIFKSSPFYNITKALCPLTELKVREATRDTARVTVRLDQVTVDQIQRDQNTRVMVFCAAEALGPRSEPCDIAFPQHGDLKCNSDDVKHNLKGMKGKPGTTRPADVTQYIRKSASYLNQIDLVYALTTKKYFLIVNLVQKRPVSHLVTELKQRRTPFLKDRVIREMRTKADDPDIVATSTNMSLKDPLQMTRVQVPCRGLSCKHNGCFDAAVYLALQEQAPTWTCPICHRPALWDNVAYDEYFDDILQNVDANTESVTIEPDGRWHKEEVVPSEQGDGRGAKDNSRGNGYYDDDDDDDDDDIVDITDSKMPSARDFTRTPSVSRTTPISSMSVTPTPHSASSMASFAAVAAASVPPRSNKRPHSETIDLTLDDSDDDQPPIARIKRPSMSSQTSDSFRLQSSYAEPIRFSMPPPPHTNTAFPPGPYTTGFNR